MNQFVSQSTRFFQLQCQILAPCRQRLARKGGHLRGSYLLDHPPSNHYFTQLDEGNRNMAAAAQMSDLKPLPGSQRVGPGEHTGQHRDMIEKVGVSVDAHLQKTVNSG